MRFLFIIQQQISKYLDSFFFSLFINAKLIIWLMFIIFFTPLSGAEQGSNGTVNAKDALLTLQQAMSNVVEINSDFVQEKNLSLFSKTIKITGRLNIKFPHFFKWEVLTPLKTTIIADQDNISIWDEESNKTQVTNISTNPVVKNIWTQIDAWFMGRYADLSKDYSIEVLNPSPLELIFKPHSKPLSVVVESITISFRDDLSYLNKVVLKEVSGDSTKMIFTNIKIDRKK